MNQRLHCARRVGARTCSSDAIRRPGAAAARMASAAVEEEEEEKEKKAAFFAGPPAAAAARAEVCDETAEGRGFEEDDPDDNTGDYCGERPVVPGHVTDDDLDGADRVVEDDLA